MTTLDQKRLLKLAGLLKEGLEEWPRGLAEEEEDVPPAKDDQLDIPMGHGAEAVRDRIEKMNAKAREGVGPDDFLLLLDPDAMINSGIDTPEKLDQYFADEEAREDYKASLRSHGGQDDDRRELETRYDELYTAKHDRSPGDVSDMSYDDLMSEIKELEEDLGVTERIDKVSPEDDQDPYYDLEDRLGRGGIVGMGRGARLEETIRALVREVLLEKKAKTYKGKSMRLGGGGRFAKFVDSLKKSGKSEEQARAIAYKAGAKKYGKEKMKKMAAAGKKRAAKKKD